MTPQLPPPDSTPSDDDTRRLTTLAEAYRRQPETADESAGLDRATLELICEEPW